MKRGVVGVGNPSMSEEQPHHTECYACKAPLEVPFICDKCAEVQPPKKCDAFALFGWQAQLPIAPQEVQKRYMVLQKRIHPDAILGLSAQSQLYAPSWSAALNQAYAILKSPVHSLRLALEIAGKKMDTIHTEADILEEGMAIQEEITCMEGQPENKIEEDLNHLRQKEEYYIHEGIKALHNNDISQATNAYLRANQIHKSLARFLSRLRGYAE